MEIYLMPMYRNALNKNWCNWKWTKKFGPAWFRSACRWTIFGQYLPWVVPISHFWCSEFWLSLYKFAFMVNLLTLVKHFILNYTKNLSFWLQIYNLSLTIESHLPLTMLATIMSPLLAYPQLSALMKKIHINSRA